MDAAAAPFTTPEMAALFAAEEHVRQMLAFEAALARAEAAAGVIPADAAEAIAAACRADGFDAAAIFRDTASAGTPAIPLVRALTTAVDERARGFVHWGTTSQDAIDTALMLQMRAGLDLLVRGLLDVAGACATLAERHRETLMPGRTLLQQALPITFGLKSARWSALATRQALALHELRERGLAVQLGGAAGTLAALGTDGPRIAELLAADLDLPLPDLPWHAERDRVATIACALGVAAGSMAKIAADIALLAQSEVGEAHEAAAPGKGGSSTLPQKRNPVDATFALAAARLAVGLVPVVLGAMTQEHERGVGGWQAEWRAVPELFCYTAGAVAHVGAAVAGLALDAERMRANLDLTRGLIMAESLTMALAPRLGRQAAQQIVQAACRRAEAAGATLARTALDDERIGAVLSPDEIARALDPAGYLGSSNVFIDRAIAQYRVAARQMGVEPARGERRHEREVTRESEAAP